jgi:hypothetical protein
MAQLVPGGGGSCLAVQIRTSLTLNFNLLVKTTFAKFDSALNYWAHDKLYSCWPIVTQSSCMICNIEGHH